MMAKEAQSSNVWLPGIVLLAVAATSYLVHQTAFQSSRPIETKTRSQKLVSPGDVEARLWQDPLYALDEHLKGEEGATGGKQAKANHHSAATLQKEISDRISDLQALPEAEEPGVASDAKFAGTDAAHKKVAPLKLTVLAVMVPGAPYAEPAERRRRIRYAVLSGMSRSGLVPEDQEHIFFFTHESSEGTQYIPYEFLKRTGSPKGSSSSNGTGPALSIVGSHRSFAALSRHLAYRGARGHRAGKLSRCELVGAGTA